MKSKPLVTDILARCGRCADILPEATLTYCPACGVTFSEVPVTQSYTALADRAIEKAINKEKLKWSLLTFLIFLSVFVLQFLLSFSRQQKTLSQLGSLIRPLDIYVFDFKNLPQLPDTVKRQSLGIALQAFQDHFGVSISEISYRENKLPKDFQPLFSEIQNSLTELSAQASSLSFWEQKVYPQMTRNWIKNPLSPLPVIITNLPLYVDEKSNSQIETRHLGKSRLISGLGHPAFVLISTYRLHADKSHEHQDIPIVRSDIEKARFLGEYILAHELGHALLGLPDFVEEKSNLRTPASIAISSTPSQTTLTKHCLMHTDAGGGFFAWENLKQRKLGAHSSCAAYETTKSAILLREESLQLIKQGAKLDARLKHEQSVALLKENTTNWLTQLVQKEHFLFSSPLRYWWSEIFMVE